MGFGPVAAPFGVDEPREDLVDLAACQFGQVAAEGPAAVGAGTHPDVTVGVEAFVAGTVTVGVGQRFPHPRSSLELVERQADRVVQQRRRITLQHRRRDPRVRRNARHQLRLRDTDTTISLGVGPLGQRLVQARGLHTAIRLRPRQLTHVLHHRPRREEPLRPERVRPIHHPHRRNLRSLHRPAQRFECLEPAPQLDRVQRRDVHVGQPRQPRRRPRDRSTRAHSHRLARRRVDQPQPHRLQHTFAGVLAHLLADLDTNRTHAPIMTKGCRRDHETTSPRRPSLINRHGIPWRSGSCDRQG